MKIAIIGASSFIGFRFFTHLRGQFDVVGTYFKHQKHQEMVRLDISQQTDVELFIKTYMPDTILWVAGSKDLTLTEDNLEYAYSVNTYPLSYLIWSIDKLDNYHPRVVFFSTDYVFDGVRGNYRHTDTPTPQTNYGISNQKAEYLLQHNYDNAIIIRTSAVMGKGGTFFDFLVSNLQTKEVLELYDDTIFTPTPMALLIQCVMDLLCGSYTNDILHICGSSVYTRYSFGMQIRQILQSQNPSSKLAQIIPVKSQVNKQRLFFPNLSLVSSFPLDDYRSELI